MVIVGLYEMLINTPLIAFKGLCQRLSDVVCIDAECLQLFGSFDIRVPNAIDSLLPILYFPMIAT